MISDVVLLAFDSPAVPGEVWPDKPLTIGNLIRDHIERGWLKSAVPFGVVLNGPETVWKETLVLTDEGRKLFGETQ